MRHIELERCFNVRDIGGYATRDGRRVRWQRVYRAGGPHALTENDAKTLRALNIVTVFDLRTIDESGERGSYRDAISPRALHHLPMVDALPDEASLAKWENPEYVADHYFEMLTGASNAMVEALSVLSDASAYPALIHCSAGKDRTGVLVATLLALLGVEDETIIADYALSGAAMTQMLEHFKETSPEARERLERHAPAILAAEPAAMAGFLARVRAAHGDFAGYVESLGVAATVPSLQAALLD
jgi:protein-tyrosine phosphatase